MSDKYLSKRNCATLRRVLKTADKYDLMYLFGGTTRRFLVSASRGRKLSPWKHEQISEGCALAREEKRKEQKGEINHSKDLQCLTCGAFASLPDNHICKKEPTR